MEELFSMEIITTHEDYSTEITGTETMQFIQNFRHIGDHGFLNIEKDGEINCIPIKDITNIKIGITKQRLNKIFDAQKQKWELEAQNITTTIPDSANLNIL